MRKEFGAMAELLYRLPNGIWITPSLVTRINAYPATTEMADHVTVVSGDSYNILLFISFSLAQDYADTLARMVNESRSHAPPSGEGTDELAT